MKITKLSKTVLAVLCAFYISACTSSLTGKVSEKADGEYDHLVQAENPVLRTRVSIVDMKTRKVGDLMTANASLRNRWHLTLDFQYQFRWYDQDGFEIDPGSRPWKKIKLAGKEDRTVQATAPNPTASSFKVFVRD